METRLTLRPGMPGTKKLLARYGERLVCVRYLYDEARNRRLKTVELVIEEAPWHGLARRPRRNDHDLVGVRIAWNESGLRSAVKQAPSGGRGKNSGKCPGRRCAPSASVIVWSPDKHRAGANAIYIAAYGFIYGYIFAYTGIWF
jgi:hypothetical protein